jgi:hypothetical protein
MSQVALAEEKKKEHIRVQLEHLASVQMEGWLLVYMIRLSHIWTVRLSWDREASQIPN